MTTTMRKAIKKYREIWVKNATDKKKCHYSKQIKLRAQFSLKMKLICNAHTHALYAYYIL